MKRFTLFFLLAFTGTFPSFGQKEFPIAVPALPGIPSVTPPESGLLEEDPDSLHFEFARIKAGVFMMGSDPNREPERNDSETLHQVKISKSFWLQTTEVTQGLFEDIMGYPAGIQHYSTGVAYVVKGPNFPASNVSPTQVDQFMKALNKRRRAQGDNCRYSLPTEAQWEYAVRAGSTTRWFFGDDENMLSDYSRPGSQSEVGQSHYESKSDTDTIPRKAAERNVRLRVVWS